MSLFHTSHCCRSWVESTQMHVRGWGVHFGSTSDARRSSDGGGRNKPATTSWCDRPSTAPGQGEDRDSAQLYPTPTLTRCWISPQGHVARVFAECRTINILSYLGWGTIDSMTSNSWLPWWQCTASSALLAFRVSMLTQDANTTASDGEQKS